MSAPGSRPPPIPEEEVLFALDSALAAAALLVTCERGGVTLGEALLWAFAYMEESWPRVHLGVCQWLAESDNHELLLYALPHPLPAPAGEPGEETDR